jgi:hypothetical protein
MVYVLLLAFTILTPFLLVIRYAISRIEFFPLGMRNDIWKELKLNECRNCRTRTEPGLSPEPEVCPLCGWVMVNMTLAEFRTASPTTINKPELPNNEKPKSQ